MTTSKNEAPSYVLAVSFVDGTSVVIRLSVDDDGRSPWFGRYLAALTTEKPEHMIQDRDGDLWFLTRANIKSLCLQTANP